MGCTIGRLSNWRTCQDQHVNEYESNPQAKVDYISSWFIYCSKQDSFVLDQNVHILFSNVCLSSSSAMYMVRCTYSRSQNKVP